VARSALVNPYLGAWPSFQQVPGSAGVIKVNVGQKDRSWLLATECFKQRVGASCWARVDDYVTDLPATEDLFAAKVQEIYRAGFCRNAHESARYLHFTDYERTQT
jgi:hypothetical protein